MADNRTKWAEAHQQILARLDIEAEYKQLGLRIPSGSHPRESGWMKCHAIGRADNSPSAEINVGDGSARGRYRDFGSGDSTRIGLFDFAAKFGPFGGDWRKARNHYAHAVGVKLPKDEELYPADKFEFDQLLSMTARSFARAKQGISASAVLQAGGRSALWPAKLNEHLQQFLIAFPMFGGGLLDADPTAFHCVQPNGQKIRKYRGKGATDEYIKTMTVGTPGLVNVAGLAKLSSASIVWLVEGVTDMLALQSILPEDQPHVVLTPGACSYGPRAEFLPHFTGKDIRICFDIDADGAGARGADLWVRALLPVASSVRNIKLPYEPGGDKNDLRDWLNEGHSYLDLLAYAETFAPEKPEETPAFEPHHAVLDRLNIIVCGQIEGTEQVEIFSRKLHKKTLIRDLNRFSADSAMLAFGGEVCDEAILDAVEPIPGKYRIADVRRAIAREAAKHPLSKDQTAGAGVWKVKDSFVLVGPRCADAWTPDGTLNRVEAPVYGGKRIDFSGKPWYERETLARYLQLSANLEWCSEQVMAAEQLFKRWDNWYDAAAPLLLAGLIPATWLQTAWELRPMVACIGPTNSGKTYLIKALKRIFGDLSQDVVNPSEAGIRQQIQNTAQIAFIDEFDKCKHKRQVLDLARGSSRGSIVPRGTTGAQGGINFSMRNILWFGGIHINLTDAADANRFIVLKLHSVPKNRPVKLTLPSETKLRDLGLKLLAVALRCGARAMELSQQLCRMSFQADNRVVELHAVPVAMYATALGATLEQAAESLDGTLKMTGADEEIISDEAQLLGDIFDATIMLGRGEKTRPADLIQDIDWSASQVSQFKHHALEGVGIKLLQNPYRVFFNRDRISHELLRGTRFADVDILQILSRVPGCKSGVCQRVGGRHLRGVEIPCEILSELCGLAFFDKQGF